MEREGLDETALRTLAAELAGSLLPGDVVVLAGEVGSGKTAFVRAAASRLGVEEEVTSPTYQLARGYRGAVNGERCPVNHLDLYRLEGLDVRDSLDLEEYLDPGSVTFIEWAEPALSLLEDPTVVELSHETPATRRARLWGPAAERLARYRRC